MSTLLSHSIVLGPSSILESQREEGENDKWRKMEEDWWKGRILQQVLVLKSELRDSGGGLRKKMGEKTNYW